MICILAFSIVTPLLNAAPAIITDADIIILNSNGPGNFWADAEISTIVSLLRDEAVSATPIIEYMDFEQNPRGEHLTELKELLRKQYRDKKFSVVITLSEPALRFAIHNHVDMFGNAPIVFLGVRNFKRELLAGDTRVTGIIDTADPAGTLEVMLRLHPHTREILILHDYTHAGLGMRKEYEEVLPLFTNKVKFCFTDNVPLEKIYQQLERLPKDTLVLQLSYSADSSGKSFDQGELTRSFSRHSTVPIYDRSETRLGYGIIGGKLLNPHLHAQEAMKLIKRILQGEDVRKIPVVRANSARYMFDYAQLERFHVPLSRLPLQSIVMNKPLTYYQKHKNIILWSLVITCFLTLVIGMLCMAMLYRRRAGRALRISEAKYHDLYDNAPDMYFSIEYASGQIKECNNTFLHYTGYSKAEMIGRPIFDLYDDHSKEDITKSFMDVLDNGEIRNAERKVKCKDGTVMDVSLNISTLKDIDGKISYSRSIWRDITKRKQAEKDLRAAHDVLERKVTERTAHLLAVNAQLISEIEQRQESEEKYRSLASTVDALMLVNRQCRYLFANDNYLDGFGAERNKVIGRTYDEFHCVEHSKIFTAAVESVFATGNPYQDEWLGVRSGTHWLRTFSSVVNNEGTITAVIVSAKDVEDRKIAEGQLLASLKEKELLLRELHHRVKNNIQVIGGLLDLQVRSETVPEIIEKFNDCKNQIRSMALIHEHLYRSQDLANIDLGEYVEFLAQELARFYRRDVSNNKLTVEAAKIRLGIDIAIPCGLILNELIANVFKHAFPSGRPVQIAIIIRAVQQHIEIIINDNGTGLPRDIDLATTRTVGLYLVHGLVKNQLHGNIEVDRRAGTEFRITIPR